MKEAYCSYEVSKLLKEKGFNEKCHSSYWGNSDNVDYTDIPLNYNDNNSSCSRPTHQMAMAWLRKKGYHIYTFNLDPFWIYEIQSLTKDWTFSFGGFENHDAAIEAAIKYCLENLI